MVSQEIFSTFLEHILKSWAFLKLCLILAGETFPSQKFKNLCSLDSQNAWLLITVARNVASCAPGLPRLLQASDNTYSAVVDAEEYWAKWPSGAPELETALSVPNLKHQCDRRAHEHTVCKLWCGILWGNVIHVNPVHIERYWCCNVVVLDWVQFLHKLYVYF